jgi:Fe-S cluster biosynthesis and repair protein YggX
VYTAQDRVQYPTQDRVQYPTLVGGGYNARMNDLQDKIERFQNMATADPSNDMAHFSLGSAYLEAKRFAEAATSFEACVKLNPEMTRAMELGGSALLQMGDTAKAKQILLEGYSQAASKGEMRVKDGIAEVMKSAGFELPKVEQTSTAQSGKSLKEPPLPGATGKWIFENIGESQWDAWIGQGTKVINELRLDFSKLEDQKVFGEHMAEFLGIPPEIVAQDVKEKEE